MKYNDELHFNLTCLVTDVCSLYSLILLGSLPFNSPDYIEIASNLDSQICEEPLDNDSEEKVCCQRAKKVGTFNS